MGVHAGAPGSFAANNAYFGDLRLGAAGAAAVEEVTVAPPWGERTTRVIRGRERLLEQVLDADGGPGAGRIQVLHGLGGVGKTTLALELAHRFQHPAPTSDSDGDGEKSGGNAGCRGSVHGATRVWWVRAHARELLDAGLGAVALQIGVSQEAVNAGLLADQLWERLSALTERWLLVVDNADDLHLLDGPGSLASGTGWIRQHHGRGLVVVTTRDNNPVRWGNHPVTHTVPPLVAEDGAQILVDLAGPAAGSAGDAEKLAVRLGGLPLALDTVGRFISEVNARPPQFRSPDQPNTFTAYHTALHAGRRSGNRNGPLEQIWDMSLGLLEGRGYQHAPSLLDLLATFGAAPIPLDLLDPELISENPAFTGVSGEDLWAALGGLDRLGLAELHTSEESGISTIVLHPLVRDARQHLEMVPLIAQLLNHGTDHAGKPDELDAWPWWTALAPHAQHVLSLVTDDDALVETLRRPVLGTVGCLAARGHATQARYLCESLVPAMERALGSNHPDTLDTRHDFAQVLHAQGHLGQARREFEAILTLRQDTLGPDHPSTLETRGELAYVLSDQGHLDQARREYEAILAIERETPGPDHPSTLAIRHNLANLLYARGHLDQARHEYEAILAIERETAGPDHPSTLTTRHNLAHLLYDQGHLGYARREYEAILAVQQSVQGPNHPNTLTTRHNLASLLHDQGDVTQARQAFEAVLAARIRVLGEGHPDTQITRDWLA